MPETTPTPKNDEKPFLEKAKDFTSLWSIESHDGYKLTKGENLLARSVGRAMLLHRGEWPLDDKNNPVTLAAEQRAKNRKQQRQLGRDSERPMTKSDIVIGGLYEIGTLSPLRLGAAMATSSLLRYIHEKKSGGLGRAGSFVRDVADKHLIKQEKIIHNPGFRGSAGYNGHEARQYAKEELARRRAVEATEDTPSTPERYNPFAD